MPKENGLNGYWQGRGKWSGPAFLEGSLSSVLGQGGGGIVIPATLRQIGTRSFIANSIGTTAKPQAMCRTRHYIRRSASGPGIQITYYNGYVDATDGVLTPPGGAMSIKTTIEDDLTNILGTLLWSGSTVGTIADRDFLTSDSLNLDLPDGTPLWVRSWVVMPNGVGVPFTSISGGADRAQDVTGEAMNLGATVTDQTGGGTVTGNNSGMNFYPIEILGMSSRPAFALLGDSRVAGQADDANTSTYGDIGNLARSVGPTHAYINLGVPSLQARGEALYNYIYHKTAAKHCTHGIIEPGINDLNIASATAAQVRLYRNNMRQQYPRLSLFENTMEPHCTSTDGFVTTTNQTPRADNADRISTNTDVRAQAHFVDTAQVNESSLNSGLWVPNRTADGTHGLPVAGAAISSAGVIAPATLGALDIATRLWSPWEYIDGQSYINGIQFDLWLRSDDTNGDTTGASWQPYNQFNASPGGFTAAVTAQAVLTANSYGTKPGFVFDGVNDKFSGASSFRSFLSANMPGFSIGMVATPLTAITQTCALLISTNGSASGTRIGLFFNADGTITYGGRRLDSPDAFAGAVSPAQSSGVPVIITGTIDCATGAVAIYINGTLAGTNTLASTGAAFVNATSAAVTVGGRAVDLFYKGTIGELFGLRRAFSTDDRQRMEGYLAWNYSLTGNLPSDHPYKISPPMVS